MLYHIANILSPAECAAIRDALAPDELWQDGKATAKGRAKSVKNNQQADPSRPVVKGVLAKVEKALRANSIFSAAAQPDRFARVMLNRYGAGMTYGNHVDAPYIDGVRSDLSFTVFLNEPEDYEGGALVIDAAGHQDEIRGGAGSAVVYPSSFVHRVEEVVSGERLACIGWVKSRIRSPQQRELLFEVETAIADLGRTNAPPALRDRIANIRNNLLRTFGD